jgi:hypothetical protein
MLSVAFVIVMLGRFNVMLSLAVLAIVILSAVVLSVVAPYLFCHSHLETEPLDKTSRKTYLLKGDALVPRINI